MRGMRRGFVVLALLAGCGLVPGQARAVGAPQPGVCNDGVLPGGALSRICVPASGWNGDLVVWGHGYTAYNQPLGFQNLSVNGVYLPDLVQKLGYAFATTSYRRNGLAILEGVDDVRQLVAAFRAANGTPGHTFMVGASEGGIITALLIERSPELFSGGLAACGPIGNFRAQLDYWGDFRVLFDYFFPGLVPGDATSVPQEVIDDWQTLYVPKVTAALQANPSALTQLIRVSRAPVDAADPTTTAVSTTLDIMWYNVFATNDGVQELHGVPYSNVGRWYSGSDNDVRLNLLVRRVRADPATLATVPRYQTSGRLTLPLVTLHTTGDDIIPYWHEPLYAAKAQPTGAGHLTGLPVASYGHCNFTLPQLLGSFAILVLQSTGQDVDLSAVLRAGQAAPVR